MNSVLIVGAAGFLGRYTAREFHHHGWRVIGVDDVPPENAPMSTLAEFRRFRLPSDELRELLESEKPTVCVHAAGRASVPLSMGDPAGDFRANVGLTFDLLEALRCSAPQCRFVLLSSAAVYGNPATLPVHESDAIAPLSPYGFHKRQAELLCQEFSTVFGLPTIVARIFSAYGPGLRRQVLWDICERALLGGVLKLRGTGQESRDFIHAADVARAILILAEKASAEGEVYNLASGCETTIAQLAERTLSALELQITAEFDGATTPGQPLNWRADIGRLTALGYSPRIPLHDGLGAVATWARAELRPW